MPYPPRDERWLQLICREFAQPVERVVRIDEGWHCVVFELNGNWIVRVPRDVEIEQLLRKEEALLAAIAPALPVRVPCFRLVETGDGCAVAYEKIVGGRIDDALAGGADAEALGAQLGWFLAALHSVPPEQAAAAGADERDAAAWIDEQAKFTERCRGEVYPLLEPDERRRAEPLFRGFSAALGDGLELRLIHADVGPAHLLCDDGGLSGVIDWSYAHLGDPAIDFGWPLHAAGARFAAALLDCYQLAGRTLDDSFRARALFYHRLGPWYEVIYGLDRGEQRFVDSGLAGVRKRLPA